LDFSRVFSILISLIVWQGLRFTTAALSNPENLILPRLDKYEYFDVEWGTGFGYSEAISYIEELSFEKDAGELVSLNHGQQEYWRSILYTPNTSSNVTIYGPWEFDAQDLMSSLNQEETVFYLLDVISLEPSFDGVSAELVQTYDQPSGTSRLRLYRLYLGD